MIIARKSRSLSRPCQVRTRQRQAEVARPIRVDPETRESNSIARRHGLSEAQRKKLILAGRVDIKRLFDRIVELEDRDCRASCRIIEPRRWKVVEEINSLISAPQPGPFRRSVAFLEGPRQHADQGTIAAKYHALAKELVVTPSCDARVGAGNLGPDAGIERPSSISGSRSCSYRRPGLPGDLAQRITSV